MQKKQIKPNWRNKARFFMNRAPKYFALSAKYGKSGDFLLLILLIFGGFRRFFYYLCKTN